jgi:hypothetical protein
MLINISDLWDEGGGVKSAVVVLLLFFGGGVSGGSGLLAAAAAGAPGRPKSLREIREEEQVRADKHFCLMRRGGGGVQQRCGSVGVGYFLGGGLWGKWFVSSSSSTWAAQVTAGDPGGGAGKFCLGFYLEGAGLGGQGFNGGSVRGCVGFDTAAVVARLRLLLW